MKQGIDAWRGLRHEIGMIVIPLSPLYISGDNMSVLHITSKPESVIRKKSHSVCYQAVCESLAMGKSFKGHTPSSENVTDVMAKVIYGQIQRHFVVILYYTHNDH